MKISIESPDFDTEWLRKRDDVELVIKHNVEMKYKQTEKFAKIYFFIVIYMILSMVAIICFSLIPPLKEFVIFLQDSCPVVVWVLTGICVIGLMAGLTILRGTAYPNGHSKVSYEREYMLLHSTLEQLCECNEFANALLLWKKIAHLFVRGSHWFSYSAEPFSEKMHTLCQFDSLTKVFELCSYEIINDALKVSYADEDGNVYSAGAIPCTVRENIKIEQPVLSWDGGAVLTIPFKQN